MKVCNKAHEDICFDGGPYDEWPCPLCEVLSKIERYESKIYEQREKIQSLEKDVRNCLLDPIQAILEGKMKMPKAMYREIINDSADGSYRHKKQC